jgi:hypothetical protein
MQECSRRIYSFFFSGVCVSSYIVKRAFGNCDFLKKHVVYFFRPFRGCYATVAVCCHHFNISMYEGESNENRKNFFTFNLLNESGTQLYHFST